MADMSLDFRLIRYALASAEHGSFRRAAAALNIQHSSVSRGVRSLEHRIGADLFERGHAGIRPTPAGDRFLQEAASGFQHLERAMHRIGAVQRCEYGELRVAASVPFFLLGDVFERFRSAHPRVSLEIMEGTCRESATFVLRREADVAFVSSVPADGSVQLLCLRDERLVVVLPKSHRLAASRTVTLEELRAERFILRAGGLGPEVADYLRRRIGRLGSEPNLQMLGVDQCSLVTMVARGFGATIVVGRRPQDGLEEIAFVPLAGKSTIPIQGIWLTSTANPALKRLLKMLRESRTPGK